MKKIIFLSFILSFMIMGCGSVDNPYIPTNPDITTALKDLYPNVENVTWSKKGNYEVADCWVNGVELHVWFNKDADWVMSEEEIFRIDLPSAVDTAFSDSEYANYVLDNQTKLTFPQHAAMYLLEVQSGDKEYALFYSEDGTLDYTVAITSADNNYWPDILKL